MTPRAKQHHTLYVYDLKCTSCGYKVCTVAPDIRKVRSVYAVHDDIGCPGCSRKRYRHQVTGRRILQEWET